MEISWKYIRPLKHADAIERFEEENKVKFPEELRECIFKYNSGRPDRKSFDTDQEEGRVISSLLSFNAEDPENIYELFSGFEGNNSFIPFAIDPFGNLICFSIENNAIMLWLHETGEVEYAAESYSSFLEKLY